MTREEIMQLNTDYLNDCESEHEMNELFYYLLQLQEHEQQTCEDAISRQAVMDALCDGCELFKNGEQTCFTKCEEYHFLATLPPVTPQQNNGRK